jgi:hypothetical protein
VGSSRLCWGYFVSGKFWWGSGVVLVGSGGWYEEVMEGCWLVLVGSVGVLVLMGWVGF